MNRALLLAGALAAGPAPLAAQEPRLSDTAVAADSAWASFLAGDFARARNSYDYLQTLGVARPDPDANLALLLRDEGNLDDALPRWVKASLKDSADGFVWNQRGWAYAALERSREARESFLKAVDRSSSTADQAEARLGLGWTAVAASEPKQGLAALRASLGTSPFIMAAASYATARAARASGDKYGAIAYLRQCLSLDPLNLECLKTFADAQARAGENRSAWYAYLRVLALDPGDQRAAHRLKRLRRYITGNPEAAMPVRRISRPVLPPQPPPGEEAPASLTAVRTALFCTQDGKPATATNLYFMANSDFKIVAASGDVVKDDGKAQNQWEISLRPENNIVELRDNQRNIVYTTKQAFRIVPAGPQGSVLIKSARFVDSVGIDMGDRELRGVVEIVPNPHGFRLVNEAGLEEYLYGAVSAALPHGSPAEAYKAQAVFSRTRALWLKAHHEENLERSDLCDSEAGQKYLGLSEEMHAAAAAVRATAGLTLNRDGAPAMLLEHDNCGGQTEDGGTLGRPEAAAMTSVADGTRPGAFDPAPDRLERWTHEYPPADRYCEASGLTPPIESRWLRIIPGEDLVDRARRLGPVGGLRGVRVLRRSASGRVLALELVGSKGNLALEGEKAIEAFLSPGSLRSTLFTLQPLMHGREIDHLLVWGAGTGHGVGLCRDGLLGQAAMGRKWQEILQHYFPALKLVSPKAAPTETARKKAGGRGKPKNPRWKGTR